MGQVMGGHTADDDDDVHQQNVCMGLIGHHHSLPLCAITTHDVCNRTFQNMLWAKLAQLGPIKP